MIPPLVRFLNDLYVDGGAFSFTEEEYTLVAADSDLFSITAQVFHMLKEKGRLHELPLFLQEHLARKSEATLYQNLLLKSETDRLLRLLDDEELEVLLMKGVHFSEQFFGGTGARGTTDIDILVRPDDLLAVVKLVQQAGYCVFDGSDASHHVVCTKEGAGLLPITVEIHWGLVEHHTARIDYEQLWLNSHLLEPYRYARRMNAEDTLYCICLHGSQHRMNSIRYFLDIVQMMLKLGDELQLQEIVSRARREHTYKRLQTALSAVRFLFPGLRMLAAEKPKVPLLWSYRLMRTVQMDLKGPGQMLYSILYHLIKVYDRPVYVWTWLGYYFVPYVHPALLALNEEKETSRWRHMKTVYTERWKRLSRFVKLKKYV
ncbi:nucleotidyltransferase family protein [Paenibacillus lutrae]|nr:nucleotidyltransferase family protein [Paenibacillus lutrae]